MQTYKAHSETPWTDPRSYLRPEPIRPTTMERIIIRRWQRRITVAALTVAVLTFLYFVGQLVRAVLS